MFIFVATTMDSQLICSGTAICEENKTYAIDYYSDLADAGFNVDLIVAQAKPHWSKDRRDGVSFKDVVSIKYKEEPDFNDMINWSKKMLDKLLKLSVFY